MDATHIPYWLLRILESLGDLHRKVNYLMTTEAEFQADLDEINADLLILLDMIMRQSQTITALKAQIAAGSPVSQAQIDALDAEAKAMLAKLQPVVHPVVTPEITSAPSTGGQVGVAFAYQITATGSPTSFGAENLPAGLSVDTATGAVTGVPTAAGTFTFTVSATVGGQTGSASVTASIVPGVVPAA